jgi:hypothetical protein
MMRLLHDLLHRLSPHRAVLGQPIRISGEMLTISFRGQGPVRFRVQHAGDEHGEPDELSWCDVSMISNANIDPEAAIGRDHNVSVLVDQINGDRDIHYRRHRASWMRILANEDQDEEARNRCRHYKIAIKPAHSA